MTAPLVRRPEVGGKAAPADLGDLEKAWAAYCRAAQKASHSIAEGVVAGRCWHQWLRLFERSP